ncbi:MAG: GTP cyclohydrolase II [Candidatus Micrarchaeota archaeon]
MNVKKVADAFFPTRHGDFTVHAFVDSSGREHLALTRCGHEKHDEVPVRVHSRCLTGDTLTSLRCDCRDQLEASMEYLDKKGCGVLIYLDQEGRGIGLANKIKAYSLQDGGMDTVEANVHLGFGEDQRDYGVAAEMLKALGIDNIALLTNNPKKIADLERHGITVVKRIPISVKPNKHNKKYLDTKREKMAHML